MASLSTRSNGTRFIQFAGPDGSRPTIRLGRLPKKEAETILAKVEALAAAALAKTSWDRQTAEWVGLLDARLHDKLAAVGLVPKRADVESTALAGFLDGYVAKRSDVKPGTRANLTYVRNELVQYFGAESRYPT